jgi:hypothetical protein
LLGCIILPLLSGGLLPKCVSDGVFDNPGATPAGTSRENCQGSVIIAQLTASPGTILPTETKPIEIVTTNDGALGGKDTWEKYQLQPNKIAYVGGRPQGDRLQKPAYACGGGFLYLNLGSDVNNPFPVHMLPLKKQSAYPLNPGGLTSERTISAANAIVPFRRASLQRVLARH